MQVVFQRILVIGARLFTVNDYLNQVKTKI